MLTPAVVAQPPPGWVVAAVPRPPLGDAADAHFTSFTAWRSPDGAQGLVHACVAAPIPGWVEDMRPPLEARGIALAGSTAERIAGIPVEARPEGSLLVLRAAGGAPEPIGAARTALGFADDGRVVTCLAACARTDGRSPGSDDCRTQIAAVRFAPGSPPPPPGLVLGAVTSAVHHPREAAAAAGALITAAAVLAIATRRKPRTRI